MSHNNKNADDEIDCLAVIVLYLVCLFGCRELDQNCKEDKRFFSLSPEGSIKQTNIYTLFSNINSLIFNRLKAKT